MQVIFTWRESCRSSKYGKGVEIGIFPLLPSSFTAIVWSPIPGPNGYKCVRADKGCPANAAETKAPSASNVEQQSRGIMFAPFRRYENLACRDRRHALYWPPEGWARNSELRKPGCHSRSTAGESCLHSR